MADNIMDPNYVAPVDPETLDDWTHPVYKVPCNECGAEKNRLCEGEVVTQTEVGPSEKRMQPLLRAHNARYLALNNADEDEFNLPEDNYEDKDEEND